MANDTILSTTAIAQRSGAQPENPTTATLRDASRGLALGAVFGPGAYLAVLGAVYALAFIPSRLGWWSSVNIDLRYLYVYLTFVGCFVGGRLLAGHVDYGRRATLADMQMDRRAKGRFAVVLCFSLICLLAMAMKAGGFAVFAPNPGLFRRDFSSILGGFVVYPTFLITALAVLAFCQFWLTRRFGWLWIWAFCFFLQAIQLNRQEMVICVLAPQIILLFFKRLSPGRLIAIVLACMMIGYALGLVAIGRYGGTEYISRSIPEFELPFWVTLTDLTGTIRLGHNVVDSAGEAGLGGTYVWGVFASIIIPDYQVHGAMAIRTAFTNSQTAQSIPAPLSYFADTGLVGVAILGFVQGILIQFLWQKAKIGDLYSRVIYSLVFLGLLWTIRSGTVLFSPIILFQTAAISFIFGSGVIWDGLPKLVTRVAAALFVLTIPLCLVVLLTRL